MLVFWGSMLTLQPARVCCLFFVASLFVDGFLKHLLVDATWPLKDFLMLSQLTMWFPHRKKNTSQPLARMDFQWWGRVATWVPENIFGNDGVSITCVLLVVGGSYWCTFISSIPNLEKILRRLGWRWWSDPESLDHCFGITWSVPIWFNEISDVTHEKTFFLKQRDRIVLPSYSSIHTCPFVHVTLS